MNQGGLSPGLGIDMASQALSGVTQGRENDSGDGIVVSFAGQYFYCCDFMVYVVNVVDEFCSNVNLNPLYVS
jgi:hypothetical protein